MKLAILIPTLENRRNAFLQLVHDLYSQIGRLDCEVLPFEDNGKKTIGFKRNYLIDKAVAMKAQYIAFFDDDDIPGENYIQRQMEVVESGKDCGSLKGLITINGGVPEIFEHSMKYPEWKTNEQAKEGEVKFERGINHLNAIKTSIASQIKFPEINFSEDHKFSIALQKSGLLKTEHQIEDIIYHYEYKSKK